VNVRQLIAILENIEDKELPVYARSMEDGCCGDDVGWDELSQVEPSMITEYVWTGPEGSVGRIRRVPKSINVIKLDVY
jgi:hypothetical protein